MYATKIVHILQNQEKILNAKIKKIQKRGVSNEVDTIQLLFMKIIRKLLRSLKETVWMVHLLKTSILVTKTPLTTLKCMSKATLNQTLQF